MKSKILKLLLPLFLCSSVGQATQGPPKPRWSKLPHAVKRVLEDIKGAPPSAPFNIQHAGLACANLLADPTVPTMNWLNGNSQLRTLSLFAQKGRERDYRELQMARDYEHLLRRSNSPHHVTFFPRTLGMRSDARGFIVDTQTGDINSFLKMRVRMAPIPSQRAEYVNAWWAQDLVSELNALIESSITEGNGPSAELQATTVLTPYGQPPFVDGTNQSRLDMREIRQDPNYGQRVLHARSVLSLYGYSRKIHRNQSGTAQSSHVTILYDMGTAGYPYEWMSNDVFNRHLQPIRNLTRAYGAKVILYWDSENMVELGSPN